MYKGFRNHTRARLSVKHANQIGIDEREILGDKGSVRIVKILTENRESGYSFLTLVQQPGHDPKAYIQESRLSSVYSLSPVQKPTGDMEAITALEALCIVTDSLADNLLIAGELAVKKVLEFFPELLDFDNPI